MLGSGYTVSKGTTASSGHAPTTGENQVNDVPENPVPESNTGVGTGTKGGSRGGGGGGGGGKDK